MESIFLCCPDIPQLVIPIKISMTEDSFQQRSYRNKGSYWLSRRHHCEVLWSQPRLGQPLRNICVTNDHEYVRPRFLTCIIWVRVVKCCEITCFHVFSSVLLCPLRFPHTIDVQFILAPISYIGDLCFDYFFCIYLPILVSSTMFMSDDVRVI